MIKFDTYIIYLVASVYLHGYYSMVKKMAIWEGQAQELDFQRLFEFGSYQINKTEKEVEEADAEEERKEHDVADILESESGTEASRSDSDSDIT